MGPIFAKNEFWRWPFGPFCGPFVVLFPVRCVKGQWLGFEFGFKWRAFLCASIDLLEWIRFPGRVNFCGWKNAKRNFQPRSLFYVANREMENFAFSEFISNSVWKKKEKYILRIRNNLCRKFCFSPSSPNLNLPRQNWHGKKVWP